MITSFILEAKVNNKTLDETGNKSDFFFQRKVWIRHWVYKMIDIYICIVISEMRLHFMIFWTGLVNNAIKFYYKCLLRQYKKITHILDNVDKALNLYKNITHILLG